MYNNICTMFGDEHVNSLYTVRYGLNECYLPFSHVSADRISVYTYYNNLIAAPPPIYSPWYVFSFGTWDYQYDYYDYYMHTRQWVVSNFRQPRISPRVMWILPIKNYSATYQMVRAARSWRDPFIYLNSPIYQQATDGIHLTNFGYVTLAQQIRYSTRCFIY